MVIFGPAGADAVMTEDGAGGRQWFHGPDCPRAAPDPGWLFAAEPLRPEWQSRVARPSITRTPEICPRTLNLSVTRWRIARIPLPWREAAPELDEYGAGPARYPAGGAGLALTSRPGPWISGAGQRKVIAETPPRETLR